jgi:hypothetical protein
MPRSLTDQLVSMQLTTGQFLSLQLNACFETLAELTKLAETPSGICDPTKLERRYWGDYQWRPQLTQELRRLFCELTCLAPSLQGLLSPPLDIELARLLQQAIIVKGYTIDDDLCRAYCWAPKAYKKMSLDRKLKACLKAVRSYNLDAIDLHRKFPVSALALPQPKMDWDEGVRKERTVKSNPKGDWELVVDRDNVPHLYVRRGLAYVVSYLR